MAEDDAVSRNLAHRMLTRFGCDVVAAKNGEEAVSLYQSLVDISLILMNVQMPKLDGLSAKRKIREVEKANSFDSVLYPSLLSW